MSSAWQGGASRRILCVASEPHALSSMLAVAVALRDQGYDCRLFCNRQESVKMDVPQQTNGFVISRLDGGEDQLTPSARRGWLQDYLADLKRHWRLRAQCRQILFEHRPQAVVVTADTPSLEAWLVRVANAWAIPTILVHWAFTLPKRYYDDLRGRVRQGHPGLNGSTPRRIVRAIGYRTDQWLRRRLGLAFQMANCYGGGHARRFAVMGEAFVEQFAAHGIVREKMVVTGHPEHDEAYRRWLRADPVGAKHRVCANSRVPSGPLVVFATQPHVHSGMLSAEVHRHHTNLVAQAVMTLEDSRLVVKLHPKETLEDYAFLSQYGPRVTVRKDDDLVTLIEACDVFVSQFSTTILLAMAWGKPIVTFNFTGTQGGNIFEELGGTVHVTEAEELSRALQVVWHDVQVQRRLREEQQGVVARYLRFDGRATERLLGLIETEIALCRPWVSG